MASNPGLVAQPKWGEGRRPPPQVHIRDSRRPGMEANIMNSPMGEEVCINYFPHLSKSSGGRSIVLSPSNNRWLWMTHLGPTITDILLLQ